MADEILRSKHAFGSTKNLQNALDSGKVDQFDILFLDGDTNPKIGWVNRNGDPVIVDTEKIIHVDALPESGEDGKIYIFNGDGYFWDGKEFVNLCKPTDLTELEAEIDKKANAEEVEAELATKANTVEVEEKLEKVATESVATAKAYTDGKVEAAVNEHLVKRYEISNTPDGTLIDYRDDEIRVMCKSDAVFTKQNVGSTGNANMMYMSFKAFAPKGAVSFKEGDRGVIIDEMFTFDSDFAGTDEYGRNYSICWLALASCDSSGTWTYFGKNSTIEKYISKVMIYSSFFIMACTTFAFEKIFIRYMYRMNISLVPLDVFHYRITNGNVTIFIIFCINNMKDFFIYIHILHS